VIIAMICSGMSYLTVPYRPGSERLLRRSVVLITCQVLCVSEVCRNDLYRSQPLPYPVPSVNASETRIALSRAHTSAKAADPAEFTIKQMRDKNIPSVVGYDSAPPKCNHTITLTLTSRFLPWPVCHLSTEFGENRLSSFL